MSYSQKFLRGENFRPLLSWAKELYCPVLLMITMKPMVILTTSKILFCKIFLPSVVRLGEMFVQQKF